MTPVKLCIRFISKKVFAAFGVTLFFGLAPFSIELHAKKKAFWKAPDNYKKMLDESKILVAAKTEQGRETAKMSVIGAGIVSTPLQYTYATVTKFEDLPKVSDRFHEVRHNKKDNQLFIHMSALGYHVRMLMQLRYKSTQHMKSIYWESIEGGFVGMKGHIRLEEQGPRKTEMSIDARYESKKLPLPEALMGIGLEVVTQRVAGAMREYIEAEYKK